MNIGSCILDSFGTLIAAGTSDGALGVCACLLSVAANLGVVCLSQVAAPGSMVGIPNW